jgi:acyl carrier protein
MGLDVIEMIMEVEETFDITIPDEEAERIRTVGDLFHVVLGRIPLDEKPPGQSGPVVCLTSRVFYRVRRILVDGLEVDRRRIRPATAVEELIPESDRRRWWSEASERLGWTFPDLRRPRWVVWALWLLFGGLSLSLFGYHFALLGLSEQALVQAAVLNLLIGYLYLIAAYAFTKPVATRLPLECASVRGLVEQVVARNHGKLRREAGLGRPEEVWKTLQAILVEQLGVPPESVTEEARIIEDLGAG